MGGKTGESSWRERRCAVRERSSSSSSSSLPDRLYRMARDEVVAERSGEVSGHARTGSHADKSKSASLLCPPHRGRAWCWCFVPRSLARCVAHAPMLSAISTAQPGIRRIIIIEQVNFVRSSIHTRGDQYVAQSCSPSKAEIRLHGTRDDKDPRISNPCLVGCTWSPVDRVDNNKATICIENVPVHPCPCRPPLHDANSACPGRHATDGSSQSDGRPQIGNG